MHARHQRSQRDPAKSIAVTVLMGEDDTLEIQDCCSHLLLWTMEELFMSRIQICKMLACMLVINAHTLMLL